MSLRAVYTFRLYVAGGAQNSARAVANLTVLCKHYLRGRHEIEIVDVYKDPKRALADGIFMTPTLVRVSPLPIRRIVGTLSHTQPVLDALGLEPVAA